MIESMQVVRVESWNELQEVLYRESWNANLGRFRSHEAYRGLSDETYPLASTLMRLGGMYVELERHILRNFRKYAHRNMVEQDSVWHWLSLAQHHGLPTRLLDWTYSPMVALHFATANIDNFDKDGVVWAVDYVETHKLVPDLLNAQLDREGANIFTVEMLAEAVEQLSVFEDLEDKNYTIFMEPPSIDDRIVNQHALFSVMSKPDRGMDALFDENEGLGRKIILPAELKWEIRDKLDQANITERVLFPGLDGLSTWLKRQYSPKG